MSQPFYTGPYDMESIQQPDYGWLGNFIGMIGQNMEGGQQPAFYADPYTASPYMPGAMTYDGVTHGAGAVGEQVQDIAVEGGRLAVEGVQVIGGAVLNPLGDFLGGLLRGPVGIAIGAGVIAVTLLRK